MKRRETRLPANNCPVCEKLLDACSSFEGAKPKPDDFTVCAYCATALRFNDDLTVRLIPALQFAALDPEMKTKLRGYMGAVRLANRDGFRGMTDARKKAQESRRRR